MEGDISRLKMSIDSKLQQMDDGLQWLNKKVEDMELKMKFLQTAKEDLYVPLLCNILKE